MFAFVTPPTSSMQEMWQKEGYSEGTVGAVQTFYLLREAGPWTVEGLSALTGVDTVIRLSREQAERRIWPPSTRSPRARASSTTRWRLPSTPRWRAGCGARWPSSRQPRTAASSPTTNE